MVKIYNQTISCQFSGIQCNASHDFIHFWDNQYGNCYTFNRDSSKKTSATGEDAGLELELVVRKNIISIIIFYETKFNF
jgi:hypothetical protein